MGDLAVIADHAEPDQTEKRVLPRDSALNLAHLPEPDASVALLARHPEQARLYYEALANAEVPNLRLVGDQDFSFTAGIDVTDVRQSKGLEFDIVILLEVTERSRST